MTLNIVPADPNARALSEDEVRALLDEPLVMHLGVVDAAGWPVVNPVWHVFADGVFRIAVGKGSHKARRLRATPRAYFVVDKTDDEDARGVRGRAPVRVIDGDPDLAVAVCRTALRKYTGTDEDDYARQMLEWARNGDMAVVELAPPVFRAFCY